ncbi:hypothetical protein C8F01DRAFT_1135758 [Mycena amicta]|nr:hypothetical protein C8F01DRAFT_1135758 [Mycena amicta]
MLRFSLRAALMSVSTGITSASSTSISSSSSSSRCLPFSLLVAAPLFFFLWVPFTTAMSLSSAFVFSLRERARLLLEEEATGASSSSDSCIVVGVFFFCGLGWGGIVWSSSSS